MIDDDSGPEYRFRHYCMHTSGCRKYGIQRSIDQHRIHNKMRLVIFSDSSAETQRIPNSLWNMDRDKLDYDRPLSNHSCLLGRNEWM